MSKRKKNKKKFATDPLISRTALNRNERKVKEELPLMLFSFKDFQYTTQIPPGQTYEAWQEKKLLAYMLTKFGYICNQNRIEAESKKFITVYGDFPSNSKFRNPFPDSELEWAVIKNIKGQKSRVAGYIEGHIFYIVFLDENHLFYPSSKK